MKIILLSIYSTISDTSQTKEESCIKVKELSQVKYKTGAVQTKLNFIAIDFSKNRCVANECVVETK